MYLRPSDNYFILCSENFMSMVCWWPYTVCNHHFQMEELITGMEQVTVEFDLKINRGKTRMMIVDRTHNNSPEVTEIVNCEVVPSNNYLGALISNEGCCVYEIKCRVVITRSANITTATKTRLVRTLIYLPVCCSNMDPEKEREEKDRRIRDAVLEKEDENIMDWVS